MVHMFVCLKCGVLRILWNYCFFCWMLSSRQPWRWLHPCAIQRRCVDELNSKWSIWKEWNSFALRVPNELKHMDYDTLKPVGKSIYHNASGTRLLYWAYQSYICYATDVTMDSLHSDHCLRFLFQWKRHFTSSLYVSSK